MKRTATWLLPVCCVYSVQEYTSTLHTAVARLLPVRLLCYLQRMPAAQGHALPYPLSEVMGNQIKLPSFGTYTAPSTYLTFPFYSPGRWKSTRLGSNIVRICITSPRITCTRAIRCVRRQEIRHPSRFPRFSAHIRSNGKIKKT